MKELLQRTKMQKTGGHLRMDSQVDDRDAANRDVVNIQVVNGGVLGLV